MPDPITAVVAGVGSVASSAIGAGAAKKAGQAQERAADLGVAEQRAAREELARRLEPYAAAGGPALQAQMAALGLRGPEEQATFVAQQEQSPIFQALARQGEEAMLQQASATGGLRGGNLQGALAQFRPALLNQFLTQQYERLGGMTTLGQQSAAGVGSAGMTAAGNIADLLGQAGAAKAGAALGAGQAWGNLASLPLQFAGMAYGAGKPGLGSFFPKPTKTV
jgi:hypothetical protein